MQKYFHIKILGVLPQINSGTFYVVTDSPKDKWRARNRRSSPVRLAAGSKEFRLGKPSDMRRIFS